jgi:hypothetical protein
MKQETHDSSLQERLGDYWRTIDAFVSDLHGVLVVVYGIVHACRVIQSELPARRRYGIV